MFLGVVDVVWVGIVVESLVGGVFVVVKVECCGGRFNVECCGVEVSIVDEF